MRSIRGIGVLALILAAVAVPARAEASPADVAALQAALDGLSLYDGYVDGISGPLTRRGVVAFQRRKGLPADGIAGPRTRRALGWRGRPGLGSRTIKVGDRGWDVAALQFLLQRAGHGPGRADGAFGPLTRAAVIRAQSAAGLGADGLAGPATIRALRGGGNSGPTNTPVSNAPVSFLRPVPGPIGDGFGAPRNGYSHEGLDFPVPEGTRVGAAGVGTTIFAGYNNGGFGNLVVIQHRLGYTSWYAHLSSITSYVGEQVEGGTRIGYVGSTGHSTGPHLHFEVRHYDTPIDPLPLLLDTVAARAASRAPARLADGCDEPPRPRPAPRGSDWIADELLCAGPAGD
ncbi:MAG TPA: peptidoglycan-binding protein [Solirubrobacterales bacterium]|jgi:murein DD-endopeptidase MepM/ murein hydrolase activator NlpD|nr:peptidoglycan-binding protein [Solirubrobacterales bacterium]